MLAAFALIGGAGGMGEDGLGGGEHRGTVWCEPVESTGGRQALDLASVEQARVDPFSEIVERLKRAIGLALLDQGAAIAFSPTPFSAPMA